MKKIRVAAAALLATVLVVIVLGAASIPHTKDDFTIEKIAARTAETEKIFTRYRAVRSLAIELLDPKPLSVVETGPLLAIDSGSFELSQRLAEKQKDDKSAPEVFDVKSPIVGKYPVWFMAKTRVASRGIIKVQVFARETAVDSWLLVASPEILQDTDLPDLRSGREDTIIAVGPNGKLDGPFTPQEAADIYAAALDDASSDAATKVENDGFIKQMRGVAASNASLKNVAFDQTWTAEKVEFAARTDDGGALVFATLLRLDAYDVKNGVTIDWPDGSPQKAFLGEGITTSGTLRYYHQVLLYVPGDGGKPLALGQYGGVVGADGL